MVVLVLGRVVRVDSMGHIGRHKERRRQGLLVRSGNVVTIAGRRRENGQATNDGGEDVRVGTLSSAASDFFVVKQCNEADSRFLVQRRGISHGVDQADGGTEGAVQVVQARREDELLQQSTQVRLLGIEQDHLEVKDIEGLDTGLGSNELNQIRMVTLGDSLQRRQVTLILVGFLSRFVSLLGGTGTVQLSSDKTSDGEQLSFLVEGKGLLAVKMDGQSGNAENYAWSENAGCTKAERTYWVGQS